jgi:N-acetylglucosamine-6-phosphate deacetylase
MLISAGRVVTPSGILAPGWVEIAGDQISHVSGGVVDPSEGHHYPQGTLIPGLVDMHSHGGGGSSFSTDIGEDALQAVQMHRSTGTTTMVASLVTAPESMMRCQVAALSELAEQGEIAGIHLEGPWLSPKFAGAHDTTHLRDPANASVGGLLRAGRGFVRMVTIAPELTNGFQAIEYLKGEGVVVAIGHTNADYDTTRTAIDLGATVATHLYNAMPQPHHREPGPVLALLDDPRVTIELVPDHLHLDRATLRFAMRAASGPTALVTDAMAAAGAPDGKYLLGESPVDVTDGVARLEKSGEIAGSTLTAAEGLRRAVGGGVPFLDALAGVTSAPAHALGINDIGRIDPGCRADLAVLDDELQVSAVMRRGRWVRPVSG